MIAEVVLSPGTGWWRSAAYRVGGPESEVAYAPSAFSLLSDALRGADQLVQRKFNHECAVGVCGRWLPWNSTDAG